MINSEASHRSVYFLGISRPGAKIISVKGVTDIIPHTPSWGS